MTLKAYVLDWGWEGARIIVTADPEVAHATLIQPVIDIMRERALAHDQEALKYPEEAPNNPWWDYFHKFVEDGLRQCRVYDVVEGLLIETSGG